MVDVHAQKQELHGFAVNYIESFFDFPYYYNVVIAEWMQHPYYYNIVIAECMKNFDQLI